MKLVKGARVTHFLSGFGATTEQSAVVLRVTKKGAFLDNGIGNDPTGPFDASSGKYLGPSVPGFKSWIESTARRASALAALEQQS